MGAGSGVALKFLQWFIRGIQFSCAALILAIFSYFLATLHNHNLPIETWIRAVEGISGIAVVYTAFALLLLCCLAGHPLTSFLAMALDVCFIGGFIYIAQANRGGAGACTGIVSTPFGTGDSNTNVVDDGHGGFTALPNLHQACQLESACLAVSIVAIFFFIFSIFVELALGRNRSKEKRFGPSPANGYTSGSGRQGTGFFSRFGRKRNTGLSNPNALPTHTTPNEVRESYATDNTRVGTVHGDGTGTGVSTLHKKHVDQAHPEDAFVTDPESTYDTSHFGHGDPVSATGAPGAPTTGYDHVAAAGPTGRYGHSHTGSTGNASYNQPSPVATAHFPAGNYRYDDGVYNARH